MVTCEWLTHHVDVDGDSSMIRRSWSLNWNINLYFIN
jgi:hypothetical protein